MRDLPATVVGISSQGIESHRDFQVDVLAELPEHTGSGAAR